MLSGWNCKGFCLHEVETTFGRGQHKCFADGEAGSNDGKRGKVLRFEGCNRSTVYFGAAVATHKTVVEENADLWPAGGVK